MKLEIKNRYLYIGATGVPFTSLSNIEDVRNFVEQSNFVSGRSFFIGDLSQLSSEAIASLLKFIEETKNEIACYASKDNISPILMSRFFKVIKNKKYTIGHDDFQHFIAEVNDNNLPTPELFLSKSAFHINKYMSYIHLPKGVRDRIGDLI